jgi:hypothetical protein
MYYYFTAFPQNDGLTACPNPTRQTPHIQCNVIQIHFERIIPFIPVSTVRPEK